MSHWCFVFRRSLVTFGSVQGLCSASGAVDFIFNPLPFVWSGWIHPSPPRVTFLSHPHVLLLLLFSSSWVQTENRAQRSCPCRLSVSEQLCAAAHPQTTSRWRRTADVRSGFELFTADLSATLSCCGSYCTHKREEFPLKHKDSHQNVHLTQTCMMGI